MKKIIAIFCMLVILCPMATAAQETWYPSNQRTMAWDPVTMNALGDPLLTGDTIKYRCYYKTPSGQPVEAGITTMSQFTFTFPAEADYILGVETLRIPVGLTEADAIVSEQISWSDVAADCKDGKTFGVRYYAPPKAPVGLTVQ